MAIKRYCYYTIITRLQYDVTQENQQHTHLPTAAPYGSQCTETYVGWFSMARLPCLQSCRLLLANADTNRQLDQLLISGVDTCTELKSSLAHNGCDVRTLLTTLLSSRRPIGGLQGAIISSYSVVLQRHCHPTMVC